MNPQKTNFEGVYRMGSKLMTLNLAPGKDVYGERLVKLSGKEYREWEAKRSKLAAAILKGLKKLPVKTDSSVLYLGASYGTTPSHMSDMIPNGIIYCVEFSERVMRELMQVCESRPNMIPILADARNPQEYKSLIPSVDLIYMDVAQPDQAEILTKNAQAFLKKGDCAMIAIKARSIDSARPVKQVFKEQQQKLSLHFEIEQTAELSPFEKDHMFFLCRFKG